MLRKVRFISIIQLICATMAVVVSLVILKSNNILTFSKFFKWFIFTYIMFMIISNIFFVHKYNSGKSQEIIFLLSTAICISNLLAFPIYCLIKCNFDFSKLDWFGYLDKIVSFDISFYGIALLIFMVFLIIYCRFINPQILSLVRGGLRGTGKLKQIESNLENSRWMSKEEKNKVFKTYKFSKIKDVKKDGIPVCAKLINKDKDMEIAFNSPCHSLVIGSTGSGKTTTFVNPMIQLLGSSSAGSSMVITDPKGELFSLHSKLLKEQGYDVKVIDLRDTYSSYRWNPLDMIWDNYQNYLNAHNNAFLRRDKPKDSGLKLMQPLEMFTDEKWYEFDNKAYCDYDRLIEAIKVYKKKMYDEVYEDLNDLVSVLIPIENEKDPMWEKGARSITLATLIAMLEDSADERLGMTKDKFNFFNLAKILQNSSKDYLELRNYFAGRSVLSKAYSLSKQVCDAAEQTRASYMSIVYEKLTLFNDAGICALTSSSDFSSEQLAHKPTALFLKIPDEKDTRHNLAAIFILNIYKTLIKVASATEELSLERNVYFIMDEFGNMPKIEKFDKFITVGRSRKIWFTMIVQSYAQLNNVYGETVADIVKGNCGIKMFIGSNDMNTCKEYSELCGNITVVTNSSSGSIYSDDLNLSMQTQVRPLIYPSELQRLNKPGDIGHSIIVTFGNYPFKTYFSPSFKVPFYKKGMMDTSELAERFFDENEVFYNVEKRNEIVLQTTEDSTDSANDNPTDEGQVDEVQIEQSEEEINYQKNLDRDIQNFVVEYSKYKLDNPDATLSDFYKYINNDNREE